MIFNSVTFLVFNPFFGRCSHFITPENRFSGAFRGYKMRILASNGFTQKRTCTYEEKETEAAISALNFIKKETLVQVLPWESCEISSSGCF